MSNSEKILEQAREMNLVYASIRNYICDRLPWSIERYDLEKLCDDLIPINLELQTIAEDISKTE